jgi:hypothetical protein
MKLLSQPPEASTAWTVTVPAPAGTTNTCSAPVAVYVAVAPTK